GRSASLRLCVSASLRPKGRTPGTQLLAYDVLDAETQRRRDAERRAVATNVATNGCYSPVKGLHAAESNRSSSGSGRSSDSSSRGRSAGGISPTASSAASGGESGPTSLTWPLA